MDYLLVAVGGASGAVCRYVLIGAIVSRFGPAFPWGTLAANVSGSLVIGLLLPLLLQRLTPDPGLRPLLVVGFLGGYTTFSSYSYDALALLQGGQMARAIVYVLASNVLCLTACAAGIGAARLVAR